MILAKSDQTTLIKHIQDCIDVFSELRSSLPSIPEITDLENFWDLLFCAVYFHDFGKVNKEFQKLLKGEKNFWENQRHEVYSIPFVDKLGINDTSLIKLVILTHHKIIPDLVKKYLFSVEEIEGEFAAYWQGKTKFHPRNFQKNIKFNFPKDDLIFLLNEFESLRQKNSIGISISKKALSLENLENPIKEFAKPLLNKKFSGKEYLQKMLMWGSMKICDHFGSGGIKKIPILKKENFIFLEELQKILKSEKKDFYTHQKKCFQVKGSCLLIAPTGSGKTESAIGWLKHQLDLSQGRFFYILPYTASINAMHKRLSENMDKNQEKLSALIGVQHGNLSHYISDYFEEGDSVNENIERNKKIKRAADQYRQLIAPVSICTPFQVLKYLYGVKGFEKGLTFLSGAKLVFDEIHAYDVVTFAQIIVMLKFLKTNLSCEIMIMTATLPGFMLEELKKAVGVEDVIESDKTLLKKLKRHEIKIFQGNIFDSLKIAEDYFLKEKRIIIVCNTVKNAQEIYFSLMEKEICHEDEIVLLHGRFNQKDRTKKEELLFDDKTRILVGTQAIEVSLDIDYDVMFTEPAPLDALLQRFGRINRKGKNGISPIYVCSFGGESDHYIYPPQIVERTISELSKVNVLEEEKVQTMLDNVYPGWSKKDESQFNDTKLLFKSSLKSIQPFADCTATEEAFYEQFTNIKVLPAVFYLDYKELMENFNFVEAEKLLVSISNNLFARYKAEGRIDIKYAALSFDNETMRKEIFYLVKSKYSSEVGLTEEFEDNSEASFL